MLRKISTIVGLFTKSKAPIEKRPKTSMELFFNANFRPFSKCLSKLVHLGYDVDWNEETDAEVTCLETFFAHVSSADITNFNVEESSENAVDFFSGGQKEDKKQRAMDSFERLEGAQVSGFDLSSMPCSVSCLSWNSQGNLFAASTAQTEHEDWCLHKVSFSSLLIVLLNNCWVDLGFCFSLK